MAMKHKIVPYLFLLPGFAFVIIWLVYPMGHSLWISLHDWKINPDEISPFVGLGNYIDAFTNSQFWRALKNTCMFALVTTAGQLILGVLVALLLNRISRVKTFFRVAYFLPVVTSWVVVSLIFRFLFNSSPGGMVNYLLVNSLKVLPDPVGWLNNAGTAWVALYSLGIWKGVGFAMVILLAALQTLPEEIYSAAAIDGASEWQSLRLITLPLLLPTIILVMVMLTIGAFQVYIPIALITNGGPLHRTEVVLSYMYDLAFRDLHYGSANAVSYILAAIVFVISQAQLRIQKLSFIESVEGRV
jgi:multiple sugar transport system permease protein